MTSTQHENLINKGYEIYLTSEHCDDADVCSSIMSMGNLSGNGPRVTGIGHIYENGHAVSIYFATRNELVRAARWVMAWAAQKGRTCNGIIWS